MEIRINGRGIVEIDNALVDWRNSNFRGAAGKFNRAGDRNFILSFESLDQAQILKDAGFNVKVATYDPDVVARLAAEGWNVKDLSAKMTDSNRDRIYISLAVKVLYKTTEDGERGPDIFLVSGNVIERLDSSTVGRLDNLTIESVPMMDIRGYRRVLEDGTHTCTAYLNGMKCIQAINRIVASCEPEDDDESDY